MRDLFSVVCRYARLSAIPMEVTVSPGSRDHRRSRPPNPGADLAALQEQRPLPTVSHCQLFKPSVAFISTSYSGLTFGGGTCTPKDRLCHPQSVLGGALCPQKVSTGREGTVGSQ